jgi:hypothetical protein
MAVGLSPLEARLTAGLFIGLLFQRAMLKAECLSRHGISGRNSVNEPPTIHIAF